VWNTKCSTRSIGTAPTPRESIAAPTACDSVDAEREPTAVLPLS
jgi:hypothetical protein